MSEQNDLKDYKEQTESLLKTTTCQNFNDNNTHKNWGDIFSNLNANDKDKVITTITNSGVCSQRQLYNYWENIKSMPKRDIIIQIAMCLEFNRKDLDTLLFNSGHGRLYAKDPWDAIIIVVIDNFLNHTLSNTLYPICLALYEEYEKYVRSLTIDNSQANHNNNITTIKTSIMSNRLHTLQLSYNGQTNTNEDALFHFIDDNFYVFYTAKLKMKKYFLNWIGIQKVKPFYTLEENQAYNRHSRFWNWTNKKIETDCIKEINDRTNGNLSKREDYIELGIILRMPLNVINKMLSLGNYKPLDPEDSWESALILVLHSMFNYFPEQVGNGCPILNQTTVNYTVSSKNDWLVFSRNARWMTYIEYCEIENLQKFNNTVKETMKKTMRNFLKDVNDFDNLFEKQYNEKMNSPLDMKNATPDIVKDFWDDIYKTLYANNKILKKPLNLTNYCYFDEILDNMLKNCSMWYHQSKAINLSSDKFGENITAINYVANGSLTIAETIANFVSYQTSVEDSSLKDNYWKYVNASGCWKEVIDLAVTNYMCDQIYTEDTTINPNIYFPKWYNKNIID